MISLQNENSEDNTASQRSNLQGEEEMDDKEGGKEGDRKWRKSPAQLL
jgi:hypothetical protein